MLYKNNSKLKKKFIDLFLFRMRAFLPVACLCLLSSPALATIAVGTASLVIPAISASSIGLAGVTLSSSAVAGTLGALSLLGVAKAGALIGSLK